MSFLNDLLGRHAPAPAKGKGKSAPVSRGGAQLSVQPLGSSQGMPMLQHPEDASLVMGAQGLVPMNADIAQFNVRGRGMQEDAYSVPSPQGFTPLNADIAHFRVPKGQVSRMPFNPGFTPLQNSGFGSRGNPQFGAYNPNQNPGFNPQVKDNGYYWNN